MAIGYILIKGEPGQEHRILDKLYEVKEIVELSPLSPLFREYTFIAKIQEENLEELGISIVEKIRSIDGVLDINTLATSTMF